MQDHFMSVTARRHLNRCSDASSRRHSGRSETVEPSAAAESLTISSSSASTDRPLCRGLPRREARFIVEVDGATRFEDHEIAFNRLAMIFSAPKVIVSSEY
jgi:hypothetical protein